MSAAEVIEQIKTLPPDELRQVAEYVRAAEPEPTSARPPVRYVDQETFVAAMECVFEKHDELFRRLAE